MNALTVAPASPMDPTLLAPRLRPEDAAEVLAASGKTPLEALTAGFVNSHDPRSILEDGYPIAMFGVVPLGKGMGAPWLLGSDRIEVHRREFARRSREVFEEARRPWAYLFNHVDARNELHCRWLEWLGADFIELRPYGPSRLPFWRFEFRV